MADLSPFLSFPLTFFSVSPPYFEGVSVVYQPISANVVTTMPVLRTNLPALLRQDLNQIVVREGKLEFINHKPASQPINIFVVSFIENGIFWRWAHFSHKQMRMVYVVYLWRLWFFYIHFLFASKWCYNMIFVSRMSKLIDSIG